MFREKRKDLYCSGRFNSRLQLKYEWRGWNKTMRCMSSTHCGITVSCTTTMDTKTKKEQQKYVDSMRSRSFEYWNTIQSRWVWLCQSTLLHTHIYPNMVTLTLSSTSGRRKVSRNALQCSALKRSMLRASMARIRYSFTSSSGSFSSRLSINPTLHNIPQSHTGWLSYWQYN